MDELDEHLQQLALEAQEHSDALKRQQLVMKLWGTIYSSPRFPPRSYVKRKIFIGDPDEIYDDATYHLMEYLLRNISNYKPEKGTVMAWVSYLLRKSFVPDAIERAKREQSRIEPKRNSKDSDGKEKAQFDVETIASATPDPSKIKLLLIQKCLEEDEDDQFKAACMQEYPFINFRDVALKHHVGGLKFTEIANSFSIPYTSLKSFYDRQLKKFMPKIRHYVENTILT